MCPAELICASKTTVFILMVSSMFALGMAAVNVMKSWDERNK